MGLVESFYPESRFGGFTDLDGTITFYTRVQALVEPHFVVLDVGCGRGKSHEDPVRIRRELRAFRGKAKRVIGLDVDGAGADNPGLDEFHLLEGDAWPLPDASVDLCLSDMVLEHVEHPDRFFAEARRVLRDGGYLCLRTPNAWHYTALISRLVPNRLHARVVSRVQRGRKSEDVFPTLYRCNTRGRLRRLLAGQGFDAVVYAYEAEPAYLAFSKPAYFLGVLWQKLAPGFLRSVLLGFARLAEREEKPASAAPAGG